MLSHPDQKLFHTCNLVYYISQLANFVFNNMIYEYKFVYILYRGDLQHSAFVIHIVNASLLRLNLDEI